MTITELAAIALHVLRVCGWGLVLFLIVSCLWYGCYFQIGRPPSKYFQFSSHGFNEHVETFRKIQRKKELGNEVVTRFEAGIAELKRRQQAELEAGTLTSGGIAAYQAEAAALAEAAEAEIDSIYGPGKRKETPREKPCETPTAESPDPNLGC